jgi:hypothetical protein
MMTMKLIQPASFARVAIALSMVDIDAGQIVPTRWRLLS